MRGNVGYRHFCRIGAERVPDATTLIRLEKAIDGPQLRALFKRIAVMAIERRVTSGRRMRIDTTVVEAPIRHPTDSRLLEDSIRVLGRHVRRVSRAGVELLGPIRNTMRSVSRRAREIAQITKQRADEVKEALKKPCRGLLSFSTVGRIWRANGLKPHVVRGFKLSNDPQFIEKTRDVVGLYRNPAEEVIRTERSLRSVALRKMRLAISAGTS